MNRTLLPLAATLLLAAAAPAQDLLIRNARIVRAADPTPLEGAVLVRDGKIAAVGNVPSDLSRGIDEANIVDGTGLTVYPGFFASYSQLGLVEIDMVDATNDSGERSGPSSAQVRAMDGYNPQASPIGVTRVNGITQALTAPEGGNVFPGVSSIVSLHGDDVGKAMAVPAAALHVHLGEWPKSKFGDKDRTPSTRMGTAAYVREKFQKAKEYAQKLERHAEALKKHERELAAFPAKLEAWKAKPEADRGDEPEPPKRPDAPSRDFELEAIAGALGGKMPTAFHAHRVDDIETALRISEEFGLSPVIVGGAEAWRIAKKLSARKVPVIIQATEQPGDMDRLGAIYENARLLNAAGVTIAFRTGDTAHNVRLLPYEAAVAVAYGLPKEVALRAITLNPARIWRVDDRFGDIAVGKQANLIVVDGDPFQPKTKFHHVVVNGERVPLTNRQSELAEKFGGKFLPESQKPKR